ncbi:hypothetical protein [Nocardiopsis deserti]|uniref:hypothetical protein n=1 Tax=Nocardiopsis deserti TaxID=2605988 RepID=UPI001238E9E8|nr:hypothetical protein [Nocardiopsis deserti]
MSVRDYGFRTELIGRPSREGRAEGKAAAILGVLDARGIAVPDEVRDRITASSDLDELDRWVRRAARVDGAEDLFL